MSELNSSKPAIPAWLIWIQCIAFVVLYGVWILPEIVGFRNTALVVGVLAGLYPIYLYRNCFFQRRATPLWLMIGLFTWAIFHLVFLSQDYAAQFLEFKRIWKYAAIGAIFALGLGLSLVSNGLMVRESRIAWGPLKGPYYPVIYFGLCLPLLIYLLKYCLTVYGEVFGIWVPASLKIYFESQPFYVPKTDYVAFCLPPFAIALGQIQVLLVSKFKLRGGQYLAIFVYLATLAATLFLFNIQNIKNGMAYAAVCVLIFIISILFRMMSSKPSKNALIIFITIGIFMGALYSHVQKNESWRTLAADSKVAFQLDKYQHWKYAGAQGYPNNENGKMVSVTNYERAAWFKVGLQLAIRNPLGYGLIEDSFKKMVKARWPEASTNLSHSHSGWLDLILAIGIPGFIFLLGALLFALKQAKEVCQPWQSLVIWALLANSLLWISTEVSATVTFSALIFWVSWASGLTLLRSANKASEA